MYQIAISEAWLNDRLREIRNIKNPPKYRWGHSTDAPAPTIEQIRESVRDNDTPHIP